MGRRNHVLDGGPYSIGAEARCHGNQSWDTICYNWLWRLMGYNFGCMIASDMQFDSRGGFSGSSYLMKTQSRLGVKGSLPWQPILGLKLLSTGFVWTIVTRQLVMKGV